MMQNYSKIETLKNCVTTESKKQNQKSRRSRSKGLGGDRRVSPEPDINITHNTCFMPPGSIRFSVKIRQAAAFAYRLWRMLAFDKLKLPLGKIKLKRCCV
jgi:hypothetical protein